MDNNSIYEMNRLWSNEIVLPECQREKKDTRIAKIVADFDERIANEPKVSFRDGRYFVFDGQHTIKARERMNHDKPVRILCKVYYGLTEQDEALLFAKQTGESSKPTSGEKLFANVLGEDALSMAFKDATESCGFFLETKSSHSDGHIVCVATAMREYKRCGEEKYREGLGIIGDSWFGVSDSLSFQIIKGVMQFVDVYHGMYNRDRLISRLQKVPPVDIKNKVKTDVELPNGKKYINPIFEIYNGNAKINVLPMMF